MNSPMAVDVARKVTSRPEFVERDGRRRPRDGAVRGAVPASAAAGGGAVRAGVPAVRRRRRDEPPPTTPSPTADGEEQASEAQRAAQHEDRAAERARRSRWRQTKQAAPPGAIRNEGEIVERKPLTVWEQYAQALLFTNEIAYVN